MDFQRQEQPSIEYDYIENNEYYAWEYIVHSIQN